MKIRDESIMFFTRVSLSNLYLEALFLSWVKGVFILGSEWNVKCQIFSKQGLLAAWPCGLTESRVSVAR